MIKNNILHKGIAVFFIVLSGILFALHNSNVKRNNDIVNDYKKHIKNLQEIYVKKIETFEKEIVERNQNIIALKNNQVRYEHSIDSLKLVKNKIKVIYKEKIIKVNNFDSEQVIDYFIDKF